MNLTSAFKRTKSLSKVIEEESDNNEDIPIFSKGAKRETVLEQVEPTEQKDTTLEEYNNLPESEEEIEPEVTTGLFASKLAGGPNMFKKRVTNVPELEPEIDEEKPEPSNKTVFDEVKEFADFTPEEEEKLVVEESNEEPAQETTEDNEESLAEEVSDVEPKNVELTADTTNVQSDTEISFASIVNGSSTQQTVSASPYAPNKNDAYYATKSKLFEQSTNDIREAPMVSENRGAYAFSKEPEDDDFTIVREKVMDSPFRFDIPNTAEENNNFNIKSIYSDAEEVKYICDMDVLFEYVTTTEDKVGATMTCESYGILESILEQSDSHEIITVDGIKFFSNTTKSTNQRLFEGLLKTIINYVDTYKSYTIPLIRWFYFAMNDKKYKTLALSINSYEFNVIKKVASQNGATVSVISVDGKSMLRITKS